MERTGDNMETPEILRFLQNEIKEGMKLPEMVDIFEKMSKISIGDYEDWEDMMLFEAGTFNFTGKPMFWVSLVRQFPNRIDDEFYQLHLDILYQPEEKNAGLSIGEWSQNVEGDFFAFVRETDIYCIMKEELPAEVIVSLDET